VDPLDLAGLQALLILREQVLMIAFLDPQNEVNVVLQQVADMRRVGTERVFGHDQRQVRMILAKAKQPTARGVAFAVVLGLAIRA
jgi:hypothetical protein